MFVGAGQLHARAACEGSEEEGKGSVAGSCSGRRVRAQVARLRLGM